MSARTGTLDDRDDRDGLAQPPPPTGPDPAALPEPVRRRSPEQRARTRNRLFALLSQVGLVVILSALWWHLSREGRVSGILLPPIEDVVGRLPELLTEANTWEAVWLTVRSIAGAFALSAGAGLVVGVLAGRTSYGTRLVELVLVWAQTVPIILLYPVCVLLFGLGSTSKIVFAGLYGFFPMALNAARGLDTVPRRYRQAAASMGASRWQLLWLVQLPAARPMILSGLRLTAALNFVSVLAGEILASQGGLGFLIANSSYSFRTAELYAYILVALVLVLVFNAAVTRAEDRKVVH